MRVAWVAVVLAACGGAPCERLCDVRADAFEACLEPWDLEWDDLNAGSRDKYAEACVAATDAEVGAATDYEADVLQDACRDAIDAHKAASDCDGQWAAWEASAGVVP